MVETIEYRGLGVGDHLGLTSKANKHEMPVLFWYVLHEGRYLPQLSGRGELHGGARVTTLVTLRKCTLGNKREIKTLKFVLASTKGF